MTEKDDKHDKNNKKINRPNQHAAPASRLPDGDDPLLALCRHFGISPDRLKRSDVPSSKSDSQPETTIFINGISGPSLRRSGRHSGSDTPTDV